MPMRLHNEDGKNHCTLDTVTWPTPPYMCVFFKEKIWCAVLLFRWEKNSWNCYLNQYLKVFTVTNISPNSRSTFRLCRHSQCATSCFFYFVSDFVEMSNGVYCAGVVSFVNVSVKSLDIHRENIGYATARQPYKGAAIHSARKVCIKMRINIFE